MISAWVKIPQGYKYKEVHIGYEIFRLLKVMLSDDNENYLTYLLNAALALTDWFFILSASEMNIR